jgi:hypothetical protein
MSWLSFTMAPPTILPRTGNVAGSVAPCLSAYGWIHADGAPRRFPTRTRDKGGTILTGVEVVESMTSERRAGGVSTRDEQTFRARRATLPSVSIATHPSLLGGAP